MSVLCKYRLEPRCGQDYAHIRELDYGKHQNQIVEYDSAMLRQVHVSVVVKHVILAHHQPAYLRRDLQEY